MRLLETQKPKAKFDEVVRKIADRRTEEPSYHDWIVAVLRMIGLPYWKRTWNIQEMVLSRQLVVLWGQSSMASSTFTEGFNEFNTYYPAGLTFNGLDQVLGITTSMTGRNRSSDASLTSLLYVLSLTVSSQATDPRDKVGQISCICARSEERGDLAVGCGLRSHRNCAGKDCLRGLGSHNDCTLCTSLPAADLRHYRTLLGWSGTASCSGLLQISRYDSREIRIRELL